jgi:hypothetical protein
MPAKDRHLRLPSTPAVAATHERRKDAGKFHPTMSSDPVVGLVRAMLEFVQEADGQEPLHSGPPVKRQALLDLLNFVEERGYRLGAITQPDGSRKRIGTAEKGKLVQEAAVKLNLSPARVRDLARQLADMAANLPEGATHAN